MSQAKQASQHRRRRRAVPVLGAAGLSLSLASGAAAAAPTTAEATLVRTPSQAVILSEEEIADVSLATFRVFDKENPITGRPRSRLAMGCGGGCGGCLGGCGGCWAGDTSSGFDDGYGPPPRPLHPTRHYGHAVKHKRDPNRP